MTKRLSIALVALAMFVLVAVMPAAASFYEVNRNINQGATVFIGEQGLDFTPAQTNYYPANGAVKIGWWASAAVINTTAPTQTFDLSSGADNVLVSYAAFGSYYGPWYAIDSNGVVNSTKAFITVRDPQLSIDVWDYSQNTAQGGLSASGKSVVQGAKLGFKIGTNMDTAISQPALRTVKGSDVGYWADIKVKTESGNTLEYLYNETPTGVTAGAVPLTRQAINTPSWFWGLNSQNGFTAGALLNWSTDALDSTGQNAYPAGTYTVTVESKLNGMKDNYQNGGADYTGKTVSEAKTVTIVSNTVKIEANKDSVVRSKPFSITITGKPNQVYHLWVKGTSTMSGGYDDQPPMLAAYQAGVRTDSVSDAAPYALVNELTFYKLGDISNAGGYNFQNSGVGETAENSYSIWQDVPRGTYSPSSNPAVDYRKVLKNGTLLYANVSLNDSGTRTVQFITTNWTKAQQYTIRVENNFGGQYKSDEVNVKVEKGAVTIVAAGDQSYYLGEEVKFSGTNTESQKTWLFIIGPNLGKYGSAINKNDPRNFPIHDTNFIESNFATADVQGDNTWSWKWGTSNVALDAGTYTVYATSQMANSDPVKLAKVAYGTVSIIIKKPFISATASQSTVAKGDRVYITGTAEGQPTVGVQIWILGKNYAVVASESVNADSSFSYEIKKEDTKDLASGQYFVVAQHPMQNNKFDVERGKGVADSKTDGSNYVYNRQLIPSGATDANAAYGTKLFNLRGAGSLQGSDAAEALVQGINDPNVDDTYTKLQFLVEEPVINIDPVGDRHVGDKFTVTATTNLAVDDEVLMEIYSSSFKPTQKSQSGEFSGATGTIKVTKGDSGLNKLSFDVDASTFKPDEYIVKASAVLQDATGTALFNVLEGAAPTAVPTTVVTTAVPTTAVPTTVPPTTVATPTKTPTQPGFGALVALIGLGAVALLVVRRH